MSWLSSESVVIVLAEIFDGSMIDLTPTPAALRNKDFPLLIYLNNVILIIFNTLKTIYSLKNLRIYFNVL